MTVWQSKGVACWYCVSHSACAPFPPPAAHYLPTRKAVMAVFSIRMGTSAALRAAPMAAFTLLISADAIVNQTAKTAFLTTILAGPAPIFQIVHHAVLIFRAKIGAVSQSPGQSRSPFSSTTMPTTSPPSMFRASPDVIISRRIRSISFRLMAPIATFFSVNDPQIILNCFHKILSSTVQSFSLCGVFPLCLPDSQPDTKAVVAVIPLLWRLISCLVFLWKHRPDGLCRKLPVRSLSR